MPTLFFIIILLDLSIDVLFILQVFPVYASILRENIVLEIQDMTIYV